MAARVGAASAVAVAGGIFFVGQGGRRESCCWVNDKSRQIRSSAPYCGVSAFLAKQACEFLDAELAHRVAILGCNLGFGPAYDVLDDSLKVKLFGGTLELDSPVGVAAGFDKHGEAMRGLQDMGFGFCEVGGVTPLEQPGNAKPRVFRLREDGAIINRFGLNSDGVETVAQRLETFKKVGSNGFGVGANVARNTSSADAREDFATVITRLADCVDFVVLNISCPNVGSTAGSHAAAYGPKGSITGDVQAAVEARNKSRPALPLLIKVSPDLDEAALKAVASLALRADIQGLVVSNTTAKRDDVILASPHAQEKGGLSGAPLKAKALASTKRLYELTRAKQLTIVGVGGIATAQDAYERIRAGASVVELYTALAYDGPALSPKVHSQLAQLLKRDGFRTVSDAVGADTKAAKK
ncbi:hypothetical protein M885DRAFT_542423 [Pelagophyceae sp. CCMP2097]|nr:hypothetical protein M885DRAFT_542423 [Pelagophyceae sp. CCMP2097]